MSRERGTAALADRIFLGGSHAAIGGYSRETVWWRDGGHVLDVGLEMLASPICRPLAPVDTDLSGNVLPEPFPS